MRQILKSKAVINTPENGGYFENVGELISVVKDTEKDFVEDARQTKESLQKSQLIDLLILTTVFAGNMFCVLAVNQDLNTHLKINPKA